MTTEQLSGGFSVIGMVAFAGGWWLGGIYLATALIMGVFTIQIIALKLFKHKIPTSLFAIWGLVIVMGGLTLLLRDKTYIQLKTTIVYAVFGSALLIADFIANKNLPHLALRTIFDAPLHVWRRVSVILALFFYLLAATNLLIARYLSEAAWVGIKTFGFPLATFAMTFILAMSLLRYQKNDNASH